MIEKWQVLGLQKKRLKKSEQSLRSLETPECRPKHTLWGLSKEGRDGESEINSEEPMPQIFQKNIKDIHTNIQEVQWTPNKKNTNSHWDII